MEEHSEISAMNEENDIIESVSTAVQEIRRTLERGKSSFAGTLFILNNLYYVLLIPLFTSQRMPMNLRIKITASYAEPSVPMDSSLLSWRNQLSCCSVDIINFLLLFSSKKSGRQELEESWTKHYCKPNVREAVDQLLELEVG